MAVAQSGVVAVTEPESVEDILRHIQAVPAENRDLALAECLWHLRRLARVGEALEKALPGVMAMADNPVFGKLLGGKR